MLRYLQVRDFAIVDAIEIEFGEQLTVLTGETGAGKSIVLEALGLVLGDRADSDMIRDGASQASITAEFDAERNQGVQMLLDEQGIDTGETCIVKRQLGKGGRSRAFVNGSPVTVQQLKQLGELLVDLHGQHEHQSLLRRDVQRELLDAHAGHDDLTRRVAAAASRCRALNAEIAAQQMDVGDIDAECDRLGHNIAQLRAARDDIDSIDTLESNHKRFASLTELTAGCQRTLETLQSADQNVTDMLADANRTLQTLLAADPQLDGTSQMLNSASITVHEAIGELQHYLSGLESDPDALTEVEEKLQHLHDLARKHRCQVPALPAKQAELEARLSALENREEVLAQLTADAHAAHSEYQTAAESLHTSRVRHADELAAQVTELMQHLGMPGGRFGVDVRAADDEPISQNGYDMIEYCVTANRGQTLRPLSKVISGGELSRISLAIQVTAVRDKGIPTLVFDEVDVGIGGAVAEIVGRQLRELAEKRQVLCVTHLPQVACLGHQHLQISKRSTDAATKTSVVRLNKDQRTEEIARMLGGISITAQSLNHAREMLDG